MNINGDIVKFTSAYFLAFSELFIINIVLSILIIFMERKKPTSTLLWIMTITFFPIIGFFLYLVLGQDLSKSKMFEKKHTGDREVKVYSEIQLKELKNGTFNFLNQRTKDYIKLIKMFNVAEGEILTQENHIELFSDGRDKFKSLKEDLLKAKYAIYMEYYIFKSDELGTEIIDILEKKAKEGLEVILLVDGMGGRKFKERDKKRLKDAGVSFAMFFPGIIPKINSHINFRNHRKIAVIDHEIAYVGGLNIGDEYISKSKKFGYWRDTHLKIIGPAVNHLQWRLYLDYRFAAKKDSGGFLTNLYFPKNGNKGLSIVTSGPDSKENAIRNGFDKVISDAKKSIYIQTPYFVPDDGLLQSLKIALMSGVDVNIMIPEVRDHPFVHWASISFLGELLKLGAKCYMYREGFLHSKVLIVDDFISSVGTANFDIRSFELNFEVSAFIFDEEINRRLTEDFNNDINKCKVYSYEDYLNRSSLVKIRESFSRLLSPIL